LRSVEAAGVPITRIAALRVPRITASDAIANARLWASTLPPQALVGVGAFMAGLIAREVAGLLLQQAVTAKKNSKVF
jgi:hypothetical protein